MKAGRWWGTFRQMAICAPNNCIVWPASVRNVERLINCHEVIPVRNSWFEYQTFVPPPGLKRCEYDCVDQLLDRGMTPVFLEPVGTNKKLRLYAASSTDYGKRVLIDGLDANGQRIRTYDSVTDVWVFGEYVTLATPFATTTNFFKAPILALQKPITNDVVRMYTVDTDTSEEVQIGDYQSWEDNPTYRKTFFTRPACPPPNVSQVNHETTGCERVPCARPIFRAIVRLEFIPVENDADFLMIGDIGSIETAAQALQLRQKNDFNGYGAMWKDAIGSMRQWHQSYAGQPENTVISAPPYGGAPFGCVVDGFI